ncbi:hypothetical protein EVAR_99359_1 [Eumeta japonica]|uniref:Uncharacterized protein n=1 Tax=Eumeta variegata TaxID=151549 RepID=A0A4C1YQF1_EUMVA|nr:hypothetical protein EVAR_99359_1 [Eumeta japonica]
MLYSQATSLATGRTTYSFTERGRTARCHRKPSRVGSRSSLPGERSAAAGWSKGAQVDDLTIGLTYSKSVMRVVDVIRLSTAAVRASGGSISTFRGLRKVGGRRRLIVNRRSKERIGM